MQKHPALKPILILTTILHILEVGYYSLGSFLLTFVFSIMFHDAPSAPYQFPFQLFSIVFSYFTLLPIGFTIAQWVLYRKKIYRAAMIVSLIGIVPSMLLYLV